MSSPVQHTDVAAYALGLLEKRDQDAFESHLANCPPCTAELAEMSGLAGLLTGVEPVGDPPGEVTGGRFPAGPADRETGGAPGEVIDLVRRSGRARRRAQRGLFALVSTAAAVAVVAWLTVGGPLGSAAGGHPGDHHLAGSAIPSRPAGGFAQELWKQGQKFEGVGAGGVTGSVAVESKPWGTHATVQLKGARGPLKCELVAISKTGERRVLSGWSIPPEGYGATGSEAPYYFHGGTAFYRDEIAKFEVQVIGGETLLSVPV
ncbi:anti-sigma factor family protein [Sinosporangium siamense]|uniref:RNA polymerase subunit sigma n=1 Tax=Sinosporangium siamense TaxID=1367973 RepID=A0A919RD95_9ACTN|nr:zf-HC2 domain-containing protein [Sinosporangium siamense]GII91582.1 RNA polymerase subunit sigma [Sinosporangium siamense]